MDFLIENHMPWVMLWWRAKYPASVIQGYDVHLQNALNTRLANLVLNFSYTSGPKGMKKARAHGIVVHSQDEIIEHGKEDMRATADLLADKPFIFGNEPTLLDLVAFASLAQLYYPSPGVDRPLRNVITETFPNLAALVPHVQEISDWQEVIAPEQPAALKQLKDKENTEMKEKEKSSLADDPEKGKGDEKDKEQEKEPEDKETEKEK